MVCRLSVGNDRCRIQPPFSSLKPLLHFLTPALGLAMIRAIRFIGERRLFCFGLHVAASTVTERPQSAGPYCLLQVKKKGRDCSAAFPIPRPSQGMSPKTRSQGL